MPIARVATHREIAEKGLAKAVIMAEFPQKILQEFSKGIP